MTKLCQTPNTACITGRREDTREITEACPERHDGSYDRLLMRGFADPTLDHVLKRKWFETDCDDVGVEQESHRSTTVATSSERTMSRASRSGALPLWVERKP